MKNLARFAPVAAMLGATLFLAGCATPRAARVTRIQPAAEFTVVESSTNKELTPAQLAELREAVAGYLQEQGLAGNRLYYVKVSFPGENPGDEPQWAVVRIGNLPTRTYTILAAYPGADDYYPYGYYGYYNPGYAGFGRYGYYDPYDYDYGYYTRPAPPRDRARPDGPTDHPPGTHTRWDNAPRTDPGDSHGGNNPPRTTPPDRGNRDWDHNRSRNDDGNRSWSGPTPAHSNDSSRSYSPPPPSSSVPTGSYTQSNPAPRSESSSPSRGDKTDPATNEK